MSSEQLIEIDAVFVRETSLAWLVRVAPMGTDEEVELWLPKSICRLEVGDQFLIPRWMARKHDLI